MPSANIDSSRTVSPQLNWSKRGRRPPLLPVLILGQFPPPAAVGGLIYRSTSWKRESEMHTRSSVSSPALGLWESDRASFLSEIQRPMVGPTWSLDFHPTSR